MSIARHDRSGPSQLSPGEVPIADVALVFRPLYQQVREELLKRLIDGRWPPGLLLPSEHQLAAELGVSQGTVRKALDALSAENLLVRQQGRGTFVAMPEEGRLLFQFFRLVADGGEQRFPESIVHELRLAKAAAAARRELDLPAGSSVWQIDRTRLLDGRPAMTERITLPASRFAELNRIQDLPNNLYALYSSRYRITIGRAVERLKAVAASVGDSERIGCAVGAPLLLVDRLAFALDGSPVEWRISRCLTEGVHYLSDLR